MEDESRKKTRWREDERVASALCVNRFTLSCASTGFRDIAHFTHPRLWNTQSPQHRLVRHPTLNKIHRNCLCASNKTFAMSKATVARSHTLGVSHPSQNSNARSATPSRHPTCAVASRTSPHQPPTNDTTPHATQPCAPSRSSQLPSSSRPSQPPTTS
jgi:hypothetical protein